MFVRCHKYSITVKTQSKWLVISDFGFDFRNDPYFQTSSARSIIRELRTIKTLLCMWERESTTTSLIKFYRNIIWICNIVYWNDLTDAKESIITILHIQTFDWVDLDDVIYFFFFIIIRHGQWRLFFQFVMWKRRDSEKILSFYGIHKCSFLAGALIVQGQHLWYLLLCENGN